MAMKQLTEDEIRALPVEELHRLLAEQQFQILHLRDENIRLRHELFGKRSEKLTRIDEEQQVLFNEIELNARTEEEEQQKLAEEAPLFVGAHTRKKPGRRSLPPDLPRREVIHDLPDGEKFCRLGHPLKHIGEDISERLHVIPMQVEVERHIRHKYVCPVCAGSGDPIAPDAEPEIKMAPVTPNLIPGSIATPGLLAYIMTGKFCDALPFYRLERIFQRSGVELTRATMCFWAIRIARNAARLRKLLWDELRRAAVMHIDETTLQVLKEPGRKPSMKSFLWAYRSSTGGKTVVLFEYRTGRGGDFLPKRLREFQGTVVSDAYNGYDHLNHTGGIRRAGCWAHARRKFFEAQKHGSSEAGWFLDRISHLYKIEAEYRDSLPGKRLKMRQRYSKPVTEEIHSKLTSLRAGTLPQSPLGKAMAYTAKQWEHLLVFQENGEIPIDNNLIENDIRPFVIGRKNWLFSDTQKGASASAFFYSLIQTAKANGHEPYWYLRYLFEKLPTAGRDKEALSALLPMNVSPQHVKDFFGGKK